MKHNRGSVFLTGATGLVGSYLLKILLQQNRKVYVLARKKDNKAARTRVTEILKFWDKNVLYRTAHNLAVFDGDLTKKSLGLDKRKSGLIKDEVDEIYHCAAVTNYNWKLNDIRKVNVSGTKKILDFAIQCKKAGILKKVNHLSSAYVCGDYRGLFGENNLDVGQKFNTAYEQSKFEAEKLVHHYRERGLWVDVYRPSIVIGESTTGRIPVYQQHFYQVLRVSSLGIFNYFPVKDYSANIVPVDELANCIVTISSNTSFKNGNYHAFSSRRIPLEKVYKIFKRLLGISKLKSVSSSRIPRLPLTPAQKIILRNLFNTFNGHARLDSKATERLLRKYGFTFSEIDEDLFHKTFNYLTDINFFKNKNLSNEDS